MRPWLRLCPRLRSGLPERLPLLLLPPLLRFGLRLRLCPRLRFGLPLRPRLPPSLRFGLRLRLWPRLSPLLRLGLRLRLCLRLRCGLSLRPRLQLRLLVRFPEAADAGLGRPPMSLLGCW